MPIGVTSPLPILEQITQNVVDTLSQVTTAAGYHCDLIVYRPDKGGTPTDEGDVAVIIGEETIEDDQNTQMVQYLQEYIFAASTVLPEGSPEPPDRQNAIKKADIYAALRKDITRGGWAHDTLDESPEGRSSETTNDGIVCRAWVRYRTMLNDPFTAR